MNLTQLSIRRPILIIVVFTVLGVLGVFGYQQLRYELLPKITPPAVSIVTVYPGAAPTEVENGVTKVIEDATAAVERIKRMTSFSAENFAYTVIEFQQDADADVVSADVQRKLAEIADQLPAGAKTPTVIKWDIGAFPVLRMVATASNLTPHDVQDLLEKRVKPRLTQVKGVGQVAFLGGEEREIQLSLNAARLRASGLSALHVAQAVRGSNLDVPAGTVKTSLSSENSIRVTGRFDDLLRLREQVVGQGPNGAEIKLRQVADVYEGSRDARTVSRLNGQAAVAVSVQKQADANAVEVSEGVRAELEKLQTEYAAQGLRFVVATDSSEFTLQAAEAVNHDLALAVLLVAAVTLVFLHSLRNALIVMVAIPASLVSTFIAMMAFGFSLNLMTLLAMSLVVGILVDDSIVVLENIHRHLEMGKAPREAALDGRTEIGFTALSITLVDVVVFVPISFVPGLVGNLLREFAVVMVVSTLLSLFVSFTLTPMLASRFSKLQNLADGSLMARLGRRFEGLFENITAWYERRLRWALRHRLATFGLAFGLLVGALYLAGSGKIGSEFIATSDRGLLSVIAELPQGSRLEATDAFARQTEQALLRRPDVQRVLSSVGSTSEGSGTGETPANTVEFSVQLVDKARRTKTAADVGRELKEHLQKTPGVKVRVGTIGLFGTVDDAPIILALSSTHRDTLAATARKILELVQNTPGVDNARLSSGEARPETRVVVDHERAARYGLSAEQIGYALRVAFQGDDASKFRVGDSDYTLNIRFDAADRARPEALARLPFVTPTGQTVQLQQVARVEQGLSPARLERWNRTGAVKLFAQVAGRASGDVGADIQRQVAALKLPADFHISYEGDLEMQSDGFAQLGLALLAAILFVYLIMVALYNSWLYPLVVLFSIPLAIIGAFGALWLTGNALSIFAMLGLIMLIGMVAKNAILLVDRANQLRTPGVATLGVARLEGHEQGAVPRLPRRELRLTTELTEALVEAGRSRLRPILMTTLAMVIGMLPIALSAAAGAEWKTGLAWVLIGGLTSSMFLTLLLVPTVYFDAARLEAWATRVFSAKKKHPQPPEGGFSQQNLRGGKSPLQGVGGAALAMMFLVSVETFAQTPRALSQPDAIQLGLAQNATLKIAKLEEAKAAQRLAEAKGARLPEIGSAVGYSRYLQVMKFLFPAISLDMNSGQFVTEEGKFNVLNAGLRNVWSAGVNAQMPLFSPVVKNGIRQAETARQLTGLQTETARRQLTAEIRKAYLGAVLAEEAATIRRQALDRAGASLREARHLFRVGLATEADTLQAWVAGENLRPALEKAGAEAQAAHLVLRFLTGLPLDEPLALTDRLAETAPTALPDFQTAYDEALGHRPDLKGQALHGELARLQREGTAALRKPQLVLTGAWQLTPQSNDFNFSQYFWPQQSFIGLTLNVPVYSGGRLNARVQQAEAARAQADQQTLQARRQVAVEVQNALVAAQDAHRRLGVQAGTIAAAERSLALVQSRWQKGLAKRVELAEAEMALQQAQFNRLQAVFDLRTAEAELERVLGR